ncbi:TonB-dependent receptor [Flavobacterium agricola]|uniref:TonB-dependent receptor n=1 Tax=Flavobacterium agricola TaxID=2870839 RepID=A0ABY6M0R4_9FLAO|nr:TonB-dependent receptor [Flavobacterium agricola]UYW00793.1 TonB-dependent receptor [Flavobacterium agricola]
MKNSILFPLCAVMFSSTVAAQNQPKDTAKVANLDEIVISAIRATDKTPMAHSTLTKTEIAKRNLGQDIPTLLNYMPSVVTTTDAGNGIGYSGIRVRGSDATRVNVTINGIPYNDSESQGTFWVNLPDFASSTQNMQLQRGVGTSTNGSAAFGASLNLLTDVQNKDASASVATSFGSYNTQKYTVKFSTGLLNDNFELSGRLSKISSDGYIDRATSDLQSYFLQGSYKLKKSLFKALVFGGKEITYQAWNGIEDKELLKTNRRFNTSGIYYDAQGNMQFYKNEIDHYKQDHYQLHWSEQWSDVFSSHFALHYTKGYGYFENYKSNQSVVEYGLFNKDSFGNAVEETDLIRRKILDNNFYGFVFSGTYNKDKWNVIVGGAANKYQGDHIGRVLWTSKGVMSQPDQQFYFDQSTKTDASFYAKATYDVTDNLSLFADMQARFVTYKANGLETGLVNDKFSFFNPKGGINYVFDEKSSAYFSYAKAHREPNRGDYENGNPKPEELNDFELGWRFKTDKVKLNVNAYYMRYKNQLVVTGALNDVGFPIRENVGDSYRLGLEVDGTVQVLPKVFISPAITISQNKNLDFKTHWNGEIETLGKTNIAFSPDFIASNAITFVPLQGFQVSWLTKFVGEQFMANTDSKASKLDAYFVNDISLNYNWIPKKVFKSVQFSVLLNNIFDVKYISNGYYYTYDDTWTAPNQTQTIEGSGYYPQATFNMLAGVTLNF